MSLQDACRIGFGIQQRVRDDMLANHESVAEFRDHYPRLGWLVSEALSGELEPDIARPEKPLTVAETLLVKAMLVSYTTGLYDGSEHRSSE